MSDLGTNLKITNLKFEQNEVGRLIKGSKVIYTWTMILDDKRRKVELIHSRITGKRRISLDGKDLAKVQRYTMEFQYSFLVDKHYVIIIQIAPDSYELRIDNISFSTLMNKEKINSFNKVRKEIPFENNPYSNSNGDNFFKKNDNVPEIVNKIEEDFFENCDNKFSTEKNFKDKNYFDNNAWTFDDKKTKDKKQDTNKKEEKSKKEEKNFFNEEDFNFEDKNSKSNNQINKNPNNLLIVNKKPPNESNTIITTNSTNTKSNQANLLDFNDVFSSTTNTNKEGPVKNNNDLFSLIDFNATNQINQNLNNQQVNQQVF